MPWDCPAAGKAQRLASKPGDSKHSDIQQYSVDCLEKVRTGKQEKVQ